MPKLIDSLPATQYSSYLEQWSLNNGLKASVYYYDQFCSVTILSDTGDVTDQIYNYLIHKKLSYKIELLATVCYSLKIERFFVHEILELIEKIDTTRLHKGKSY